MKHKKITVEEANLNTSHVNVQWSFVGAKYPSVLGFKYISC